MNERLQQNLAEARTQLRDAQTQLAAVRRHQSMTPEGLRRYEAAVCDAIDRAWDAQCMAGGSL